LGLAIAIALCRLDDLGAFGIVEQMKAARASPALAMAGGHGE
jgi:hypothetical protein